MRTGRAGQGIGGSGHSIMEDVPEPGLVAVLALGHRAQVDHVRIEPLRARDAQNNPPV